MKFFLSYIYIYIYAHWNIYEIRSVAITSGVRGVGEDGAGKWGCCAFLRENT